MKKKTTIIILLVMMFVLFAVAGTIMFYLNYENTHNNPKNKTLNEVGLQTFADMTEVEEFQTIPLYDAEGIKITEPIDRGDNVYMVTVNGTDKNQYEAYLKTLKDAGYKLFADNGAEGIDQTVFTVEGRKSEESGDSGHVKGAPCFECRQSGL